jgi:hypothetical protein
VVLLSPSRQVLGQYRLDILFNSSFAYYPFILYIYRPIVQVTEKPSPNKLQRSKWTTRVFVTFGNVSVSRCIGYYLIRYFLIRIRFMNCSKKSRVQVIFINEHTFCSWILNVHCIASTHLAWAAAYQPGWSWPTVSRGGCESLLRWDWSIYESILRRRTWLLLGYVLNCTLFLESSTGKLLLISMFDGHYVYTENQILPCEISGSHCGEYDKPFCDMAPLVSLKCADVSGECHHCDSGSSKYLWMVGLLQREYTALYSRKLSYKYYIVLFC